MSLRRALRCANPPILFRGVLYVFYPVPQADRDFFLKPCYIDVSCRNYHKPSSLEVARALYRETPRQVGAVCLGAGKLDRATSRGAYGHVWYLR